MDYDKWVWRRNLKVSDSLLTRIPNDHLRTFPVLPQNYSRECALYENLKHDQDTTLTPWLPALIVARCEETNQIRLHIVGSHPSRDSWVNLSAIPNKRVKMPNPATANPPPINPPPSSSSSLFSSPAQFCPFLLRVRFPDFYPVSDAFIDLAAFITLLRHKRDGHSRKAEVIVMEPWQDVKETRCIDKILTVFQKMNGSSLVHWSAVFELEEQTKENAHRIFQVSVHLSVEPIWMLAEENVSIGSLFALLLSSPPLPLVTLTHFRQTCPSWEAMGKSVRSIMNYCVPTEYKGDCSPIPQVKTPLREYQHHSLHFMQSQEDDPYGMASVFGTSVVIRDQKYWFWISEQLLEVETEEHSHFPRGGILGDIMGSGKTLSILSLVVTRPGPRATLILVPTSLLGQWQQEIKLHLGAHTLRILVWYGSATKRIKLQTAVTDYDIVLTTYTQIRLQYNRESTESKNLLVWHRLICDEAHRTANLSFARDLARIKATRRWMMTGTPFRRSIVELTGMLEALGMSHYIHHPLYWNPFCLLGLLVEGSSTSSSISYPTSSALPTAENCFMHLLFGRLMIRHVMEQSFNGKQPLLESPVCEEHCLTINFSAEERKQYEVVKARIFKPQVKFQSVFQILRLLLPLRQFCSGGNLVKQVFGSDYECLPDVDHSPFHRADDMCPICHDVIEQPVQTMCQHVFCNECILAVFDISGIRKACPLCRKGLKISELKRLVPVSASSSRLVSASASSSSSTKKRKASIPLPPTLCVKSKIQAALDYYIEERSKDSSLKIVFFTLFRPTQEYLFSEFQTHRFRCFQFRGDTTARRRQQQLDGFLASKEPSVLFLSMRTGNCGLNLTMANHICIFEPWINSSMDEQAVSRVVRIGQTRRVILTRFSMRDSVEEIFLHPQWQSWMERIMITK